MTNFKPCNEMVLLHFVKTDKNGMKKSKGGIIMPDLEKKSEKEIYTPYIDKIGPGVPTDKINFKVGDKIIFNDYDVMKFKDDETDEYYGLTKYQSIWAVAN